jgi:hypothetical protein
MATVGGSVDHEEHASRYRPALGGHRFDGGTVAIRQQVQSIRGELLLAPVKTSAGKRDPLLDLIWDALRLQQDQHRLDMGSEWPETGLVLTTRTGLPVEPRNLVRSFRRIWDRRTKPVATGMAAIGHFPILKTVFWLARLAGLEPATGWRRSYRPSGQDGS